MKGKPFFDTNVLIYSIVADDQRAELARQLLAEGGVISVQVLNEFVAAARRKYRMPWNEIREVVSDFQALCPRPLALTLTIHEAAIAIAEKYRYRIYDSLVIATAIEASCDILYSEDMQHGQKIQGLTILNPF